MIKRNEMAVHGAFLMRHHLSLDERGGFARLFSRDAMEDAGLEVEVAQVNCSSSPLAYTLRGLHWQSPPFSEAKLLTCLTGMVFDVIADLRPDSPTLGQWDGQVLTAGDGNQIYCPAGCAHGFLTLKRDSVVAYTTSQPYAPQSQNILRWNDPFFTIHWPATPQLISDADRNAPDLTDPLKVDWR